MMKKAYLCGTLLVPQTQMDAPHEVENLGKLTFDNCTVYVLLVKCPNKDKIIPKLYNEIIRLQKKAIISGSIEQNLTNYYLRLISGINNASYQHMPNNDILYQACKLIRQKHPHQTALSWNDVLYFSYVDHIE